LQALTEACEESWDAFFVITQDFTSLAGAVNSIAADTAEIAVPSTFIATTSTTAVAAPGLISAIEVSETGTLTYTEPLGERWFFVSDGVMIDPLNLTSPKIRFANPFNCITEIRLYGGLPIVCPTTPSVAVPGTDNAGFVAWLMATASAKLYEMRVTSDQEDQRAYFKRQIFASDQADKLKAKHRMSFPYLTTFRWT
jgi:hypothetical protein